MGNFEYQEKVWGETKLKLSPKYLGFLRLKYTLDDLEKVKGKILDAGCGGGGFAKAVKHYRSELDIYGVDIARKSIASARKSPEGVKFQVGDLYQLQYEDEFFDAIIVEDVLEHLEKPFLALTEINRVLKKNGVFSVFIPLEGSVFSLHFWLNKLGWKAKEKHAGHIQRFKKQDLRLMIQDSGMNVRKERFVSHLLGQLVDVSFFTVIDWMGQQLEIGLEENLKDKPIKRFFKDSITRITNLESQVFNFVPGAGVHIKCVKRG